MLVICREIRGCRRRRRTQFIVVHQRSIIIKKNSLKLYALYPLYWNTILFFLVRLTIKYSTFFNILHFYCERALQTCVLIQTYDVVKYIKQDLVKIQQNLLSTHTMKVAKQRDSIASQDNEFLSDAASLPLIIWNLAKRPFPYYVRKKGKVTWKKNDLLKLSWFRTASFIWWKGFLNGVPVTQVVTANVLKK